MSKEIYKPLEIKTIEIAGFKAFQKAVGKPVNRDPKTFKREVRTAKGLVKRGDEHAKAVRGINVWFEIKMQVGFMIEWDTYRIGIDCLSTTSSMHGELAKFSGIKLIEEKQKGLIDKVYTRIYVTSYQTLRRMDKQRDGHKHLDWQIFRNWIKTLPYYNELIRPEGD